MNRHFLPPVRLILLAVVALSLGGCLSGDPDPNPVGDAPGADAAAEPVEEYHLARTFDLVTETVDETWSWSMDPNMTGNVRITLEGNPTSLSGSGSICYRLEWPQGQRVGGTNNCGTAFGNVGLTISPSALLGDSNVFYTELYPNDFSLRVWAPNGPDTALLQVSVDTFAAN